MHENNFFKHPDKLRTHCLRSYIIVEITDGGYFRLQNIYGTSIGGMINGIQLKPYNNISNLVT